MKKIILNIICFIGIVICQTSSISMYGYGEYFHSSDASSISMGDSKYFTGFSNRMSFASPSSYWKNSFSNLMMSVYYNNSTFNFQNLIENNFKVISFSFPIKNDRVFAMGMNPMLRADIKVEENEYSFVPANESPTSSPLAYFTDYDYSGGMSEFFVLYSSKVSKNISLGLRWSKIFGSSHHKYNLNLYDVGFDIDENIIFSNLRNESFINNNRYSSNKYLAEVSYSFKKLETVLTYSKVNSLNVKVTPYYESLGELNAENYFVNDNLHEKGFGINYFLNKSDGIIFEYHILNAFNSYDFLNIFNQNSPDIFSTHIGAYFDVGDDLNTKTVLKIGLFNKIYEFDDFTLNDNGFTFGIGYNYFDNKNFIDIAFKVGRRTTEYSLYNDESYFKLVLSVINGEKWFINERE